MAAFDHWTFRATAFLIVATPGTGAIYNHDDGPVAGAARRRLAGRVLDGSLGQDPEAADRVKRLGLGN